MNIVITGGSRGIGAEAVRRFASLGHRVTFIYLSSHEAAAKLAKETGATAICCDVADEARMKDVFSGLGTVDLLIACAGISAEGLIQDITEEQWDRIFAVNVKGIFHAVKGAVPGMIRNQHGSIITVSSMWGQVGAAMEIPYSATKGAIIAMSKGLAKELAPSHIRVNCIAPGAVRTDMLNIYTEDIIEAFRLETPLEMIGRTSDIVDAMVYLANAEFVTGQVFSVNGGYVM